MCMIVWSCVCEYRVPGIEGECIGRHCDLTSLLGIYWVVVAPPVKGAGGLVLMPVVSCGHRPCPEAP